jgi:hypothetical protein
MCRGFCTPSYSVSLSRWLGCVLSIHFLIKYSGSNADESNPLTISHTAKTISCKAIGRNKTTWIVDPELMRWNKTSTHAIRVNVIPIRPQAANHRGMSFV